MNHPIFHLLYRSTAAGYIDSATINEILERSRTNNAMRNVTGLLLYRSGNFIQLLEGKKAEVNFVYQKILKDSRHAHAKILIEFESNAPLFPDWNMGFIKDEKVTSALSAELEELTMEAKGALGSRESIVAALRRFSSQDMGKNLS